MEKVLMPKVLTVENHVKYLMLGEFTETFEVECACCRGAGKVDHEPYVCCECAGEGYHVINLPVSWKTIKEIYKKLVTQFSE